MDTRIIPCPACGGDKGHHDFAGHWTRCDACDATGDIEVELEPVELDDLENKMPDKDPVDHDEFLAYVLALAEARLLLKDFVRNLSDSAVVCPPRSTFEKAKRWLAENEETLMAADRQSTERGLYRS